MPKQNQNRPKRRLFICGKHVRLTQGTCLAEEEGFVLIFCKATLVSNFYALQKPSGSR